MKKIPVLLIVLALAAGSTALFAADGPAAGPEFQVNSYTSGFQGAAEVAATPDGEFIVAWDSEGSLGSDSDGQSIQAQRYLANGTLDGPEFQVNSYTTGNQQSADIARLADGSFAVVWESLGSVGDDSSDTSIQLRRFLADGTPVGAQVQVNTHTTSFQVRPALSMASDGSVVVVWETPEIQAQRYLSDGTPEGTQFQVNNYTTNSQFGADVASTPEGGFIVTWSSDGSFGTDDSGHSIQARIYNSDGLPLNTQFQLNSQTTGTQINPELAAAADGGFVVAWGSDFSSGSDDSLTNVQQRRFLADGTPLAPEFQVNTWTTGAQGESSVASLSNGDFVVAWLSQGSSGSDDSDFSIQAQRFAPNIFSDGFESGDTSAWAASVP